MTAVKLGQKQWITTNLKTSWVAWDLNINMFPTTWKVCCFNHDWMFKCMYDSKVWKWRGNIFLSFVSMTVCVTLNFETHITQHINELNINLQHLSMKSLTKQQHSSRSIWLRKQILSLSCSHKSRHEFKLSTSNFIFFVFHKNVLLKIINSFKIYQHAKFHGTTLLQVLYQPQTLHICHFGMVEVMRLKGMVALRSHSMAYLHSWIS